jgi:hypothetical protein
MSNAILSRDESSTVNCFALYRARGHITVRCSKQFAELLRQRIDNRAPGFGGVVFQETGRGWYEVVSRDTFYARPDVIVDEATAQIFLETAYLEIQSLMESLDDNITVITADVKSTRLLREVRSVRIIGAVSSRPTPPALSPSKFNQLANYVRNHAAAKTSRRSS